MLFQFARRSSRNHVEYCTILTRRRGGNGCSCSLWILGPRLPEERPSEPTYPIRCGVSNAQEVDWKRFGDLMKDVSELAVAPSLDDFLFVTNNTVCCMTWPQISQEDSESLRRYQDRLSTYSTLQPGAVLRPAINFSQRLVAALETHPLPDERRTHSPTCPSQPW